MNIELTKDQAAFLIRALECNCAEEESDFDPKDLSDRGPGGLIIGQLVSKGGKELMDVYYEARKNRIVKEPINKKLFMGVGYHSLCLLNQYHKALNYASYVLGGMEQNGGMGTEFDEQSEKEDDKKLKNILKDIVYAFGYSPQDLIE